MKFIMLVGCSGSGKSTLAADLARRDEALVVISSDAILEERAQSEGIGYAEAYDLYKDEAMDVTLQIAEEAFSRGLNVVWDQTNLLRGVRAFRLDMVPDEYDRIAVVFEAGLEALLARVAMRTEAGGRHISEEVIAAQLESFTMPDYDEGFDRIIVQKVGEPRKDTAPAL